MKYLIIFLLIFNNVFSLDVSKTILPDNTIKLNWTADSATFIIEKSINGLTYHETKIIQYNKSDQYEYIDSFPSVGISYYLIKQISIDYDESDQIEIFIPDLFNVISTNVFENEIVLKIKTESDILVILEDMYGKEIITKINIKNIDDNIIAISMFNNILTGIYFIKGTNNNRLFRRKIFIL